MYCFRILYIMATVLVSTKCQEFPDPEPDHPHTYTDAASCPRKEIGANRRNVALMPRERLVTLKAEPGYEFFPRSVPAKRCNGHCPARLSPMPTKSEPKAFTVHLHLSGEPMPLKCVSVTVDEHMSCRCMCMVSATNCNAQQDWDEANCDCPCKQRSTKKADCEATGMMWNDSDCSCTCPHSIMHCPAGKIWSSDSCRCISA